MSILEKKTGLKTDVEKRERRATKRKNEKKQGKKTKRKPIKEAATNRPLSQCHNVTKPVNENLCPQKLQEAVQKK